MGLLQRSQLVYRRHVRPYAGESVRVWLSRAVERALIWRVRPLATRLLGFQFRRSRDLVEIDITYVCNLKCFNCNRSVGTDQAPSKESMSVDQVRRFLEDSRAKNLRWKRIRLVGGEPTTHPQLLEIVSLILDYCRTHSPGTRLQLTTNGHGKYVNKMLAQLPPEVEVHNTSKEGNLQPTFNSFNVAPADIEGYRNADFANACPITRDCGVGVTPFGYYPCTVAGGIDRIYGFDLGRKSLPDLEDHMEQDLRKFCAICGHFKRNREDPLDKPVQSASWREAYRRYAEHPPRLSRLPDFEEPAEVSARAAVQAEASPPSLLI